MPKVEELFAFKKMLEMPDTGRRASEIILENRQ
jgi:hypothetical protein